MESDVPKSPVYKPFDRKAERILHELRRLADRSRNSNRLVGSCEPFPGLKKKGDPNFPLPRPKYL